jgi:hypothetical protein
MTGEDKSGVYRRVPALLVDYVYTLITYIMLLTQRTL